MSKKKKRALAPLPPPLPRPNKAIKKHLLDEEFRRLLKKWDSDKPKKRHNQCSFRKCDENIFTSGTYTVDFYSHKQFCLRHWKQIMVLFNKGIIACVHKNAGCMRNHTADFYLDDRSKRTTKFLDRSYDLCNGHWYVYRRIWRTGRLIKN
jgi:hypothetical protein